MISRYIAIYRDIDLYNVHVAIYIATALVMVHIVHTMQTHRGLFLVGWIDRVPATSANDSVIIPKELPAIATFAVVICLFRCHAFSALLARYLAIMIAFSGLTPFTAARALIQQSPRGHLFQGRWKLTDSR